jgi:hypothetical protein
MISSSAKPYIPGFSKKPSRLEAAHRMLNDGLSLLTQRVALF